MNVIYGMVFACCAFALFGYCQEQDARSCAQQVKQERAIKRGDKWQDLTDRGCAMVACNQFNKQQ